MKNTYLLGKTYRLYRKWLTNDKERNPELTLNIINKIHELNIIEYEIQTPPFPNTEQKEYPKEATDWLTHIHNL